MKTITLEKELIPTTFLRAKYGFVIGIFCFLLIKPLYAPMQISDEMRIQAKEAFNKGLECILKTQIIVDGLPTVWCAQHDHNTLKPAGARPYELPSFSGGESVGVTLLLMDLENPSEEIVHAVNGAVQWFEDHKIEGIRVEEFVNENGEDDRVVINDSSASPTWARFYDLETGKPLFCDRDGIKKNTLAELGINRRGGYDWYTQGAVKVLKRYPQWASKHGVEPGRVIPTQRKTPTAPIADKKADVMPAPTAADLAKLEAEVGLSYAQEAEVSALLGELIDKRRVIKSNASLSREERKTQMKVLNEAFLGKGRKINAQMTAEQFAKWQKFQEALRAARSASETAKPTSDETPPVPTGAVVPVVKAPVLPQGTRPRVIATTDGEVDDRSSMIRFLLYSCDFDVAGIVQVNSRYQKSGHSDKKWIEAQLDTYEKLLPNLRKHNPNYPDAGHLRSVMRVGNENRNDLYVAPPDMATKNTAGAQLIIDTLLDDDPRPVHVLSWGGANTTASALWKLKTESPRDKFEYAASRIRIYCIWYQDGGGKWIQENIPEAHINEAYRWDNVWDYESYDHARRKGKMSSNPPFVQEYMKPAWLNANVKTGHGPLGAMTPQKYISEGDTPSFLHLVNNGLDSHLDYTLGGWGGRSVYDDPAFPNHITDKAIKEDGNANKMYWRWVPAAQNDFAARMDWCVKEFNEANHAPIAKVKGALKRDVKAGETVKLAATATDPDGDKLTCKWWQYADADSVAATVPIANNDSLDQASFAVPNEPGKQVHIILEITDNGVPPLVGYQRVICNIK